MEDLDRSSQIQNILDDTSKEYADVSQAMHNNQDVSQTMNNLNDTYTKSSILRTSIDSSLLHLKNVYKRTTSPRLSPLKKPKFYQWLFLTEEKKQEIQNEEKQENNVKEQIEKSFEIELEDTKPKETVGDKAIVDYYRHYKKLKKVEDENNLKYLPLNYNLTKRKLSSIIHFLIFFYKLLESAYTALLSKSEASFVLPSKVGLIKKSGDLKQIQIKYYI